MNMVQVVEPFFDEVWCSELDTDTLSMMFTSVPVTPKTYVPIGQAVLVKHSGTVRQPGFKVSEVSEIVARIVLDEK